MPSGLSSNPRTARLAGGLSLTGTTVARTAFCAWLRWRDDDAHHAPRSRKHQRSQSPVSASTGRTSRRADGCCVGRQTFGRQRALRARPADRLARCSSPLRGRTFKFALSFRPQMPVLQLHHERAYARNSISPPVMKKPGRSTGPMTHRSCSDHEGDQQARLLNGMTDGEKAPPWKAGLSWCSK
jgi:hypothetical protein